MLTMLAGIVKNVFPGSPAFLLAALLLGLAPLAWRRPLPRASAIWLVLVSGSYLALSLPWVATHLAEPISRHDSIARASDVPDGAAVVLLDGDHLNSRVLETIRLYALLQPKWIVVSSFRQLVVERLVQAGIPRDRILREGRSTTTREQMLALRPFLEAHQIGSIVLVASPIHMRRALGACRAVGIRVVPSASGPLHAEMRVRSLMPELGALRYSSETLYEYLAEWQYRRQGWTA